jgi:hypothetical protein
MSRVFIYILRVILVLFTIGSLLVCFAVLASSHNISDDVRLRFIGIFLLSLFVTILSFIYPKKYRVQL